MMRTAILLLSLLGLPATAQDRPAIETTITGQLDAFTARDVEQAFQFASPMIQRLFNSPRNFGHMVEFGYPMVWDNSDRRFLGLSPKADRWVQRVMVTDTRGAIHILEYYMIETEDGWRIDGVDLVPSPAPSV